MDDQIRIPCVLMRGGTSKGPFFLNSDLPSDPRQRDELLLEMMGSGHPLEIDGLGGGNSLSSKVAIVGPSTRDGADVDYLFAQVKVLERAVDTGPNCGNMLSAVGAFAIEKGLISAQRGETTVRVHNVNTGKIIEARIQTPGGELRYQGETAIDGVPGTAAPVYLAFLEAVGAKTGMLLPSGTPQEIINGVPVSLIDGATPVVIARAENFGLTGSESAAELDASREFMAQLEEIRIEAGRRMGLGDVRDSCSAQTRIDRDAAQRWHAGRALFHAACLPHVAGHNRGRVDCHCRDAARQHCWRHAARAELSGRPDAGTSDRAHRCSRRTGRNHA